MAEKITKPDKFTKEWYGYIWDYYKAHILISIAVLVFLAYFIIDIAGTIRYDMNVNYVATDVIVQETADKISLKCAQNSDDLNGNGRVDVAINQLNFTEDNVGNSELYQGMLNKLMILFNSTDELVFVVDEAMLPQFVDIKYSSDIFYKTTEWLGEAGSESGEFAASLKDSAVLKEMGIDTSDLYVLVAKADDEEGFKPEEENAIKIAKYLLK